MSRKKRSAKTLKKAAPPKNLLAEAMRHQAAGQLDDAEPFLRQALEADPNNLEALVALAANIMSRGQAQEAVALCRRVAELQPDHAEARNNLGKVLAMAGNRDEAVEVFRQAVKLDPGLATAHYNLGTLLKELGEPEQALISLARAVECDPDFVDARINLGTTQQRIGHFDDAEAAFKKVLEMDPGYNEARYNLAHLYQHSRRLDEAIAIYRQTLEKDPSHILAHHNLGLTLLTAGQMREGWEQYEWRWRIDEYVDRPIIFPQAPLENYPGDGGSLEGKTILVWAEQGIGDEMLFANQIPDLVKSGGSIILECEPRLVPLFERSFPGVTCVAKSDPPHPDLLSDDIDFQTPVGGLCRFLRADLESFPEHAGYLKADAAKTRELRQRYGGEDKFLVGLCWGSADKKRPWKSIPLMEWRPVLEVPGVTFVNLQYGDTAAVREEMRAATGIEILHDEEINPLTDMDGFAAQVAAMDLTISITNTTITTAGTLGRSGWALVPFESSWVWMLGRETNIWNPSIRLFPQDRFDGWESVMERVARDLRQRVKAS
ncbi:MAG: tetratricopeptide repeat protein [Alphaproteobacteria bacterium]|nr:tetratricopeptide repeat protein [Alphaproteobacteria bacterium]